MAADVSTATDAPSDGRTLEAVAPSDVNGTTAPTEGTNRTATPTPSPTPGSGANWTATPGAATSTPAPSTTPTPGSTANGALVVSGVETPDGFRVGDRLVVNATVTNPAPENATGTLRYTFDGATVTSRTVTLGPGESRTVEFDLPFADLAPAAGSVDPGTYVHGVRNASGEGSARWLRVTPDVDLSVERFEAPVEVAHGDPYVVHVTVANPGDTSVTRQVTYEFAGRAVANRAVTVAGNDDRQVAFEARLSDVKAVVGPPT